uniref:Quinone oxidoreductase PIG3-like n=1 Tax=Saccoglossus kowalevskii TaxID=10224 RepID=A0ABM0GKX1_SACKO|nr:PREDICTED: quinone oxidoreductase PIG3-like [Saccoglossus kowalevskii]
MATTMQAVQLDEPGTSDKLYIGTVAMPTLTANEVLIKVFATAINRADLLQRKGLYPPPKGASNILGLEAVGIIEDKGINCSDKLSVGDRVLALLPGGGNAEYVTAHEGQVAVIPSGMSFTTAAAIPEVWLTAYQLLHFVGKLQKGEHVLIHAGGSGVGTAAVQLVRLAGGVPIVTAGSEDKIKKAVSLGAEVGFNYKEGSFVEKVLKQTNSESVSLIFSLIAHIPNECCYLILQYKTALVKEFSENALPYFNVGSTHQLKTVIDTVFPLQDIGRAHQYMEDNKNIGKIVIQVRDEKQEPPRSEL